jgi:hypothetical protein
VVGILEHGQIAREECVDSADDALLIAGGWEEQEEHPSSAAVPPDPSFQHAEA